MADTDPYTKIPNALLDRMAELGNAELRVLLAIVRRTAGWQKECDVISLTQLEKATGIARKNVVTALAGLLERGWIDREPAKRNGFCYRLVTLSNQLPKGTSNPKLPELVTLSNQSDARLVTLSNTQKKDLKKDLKKEGRAQARIALAPSDDLAYSHLAVITYHTYFKRWPDLNDARAIATLNPDFERWSAICDMWKKNRWDFLKVGNLINRYEKGNSNATNLNGRHATAAHPGSKPKRYDK